MLARKGFKVKVYDRLPEPVDPNSPEWGRSLGERNYNIGLNGRGQKVLKHLGIMSTIEQYSANVYGRMDWSPQTTADNPVETIFTDRPYITKCVQRERLVGAILEDIKTKYSDSISCEFLTECTNIEWLRDEDGNEICIVALSKKNLHSEDESNLALSLPPNFEWIEKSDFVIGADGAQSFVRNIIDNDEKGGKSQIQMKRFEDKNVRVYRTIPIHFPDSNSNIPADKKRRKDLNYSARTKLDINLDALPTKEGIYLGVVLYRPWDQQLKSLNSTSDARDFFNRVFPMFSPYIYDSDLAEFVKKGDSKLPKFSYVGPQLHKGKTTLLLGDVIHVVKPFFGLGVNSGFEDVLALEHCLNKTDDNVGKSLQLFSRLRGKEAKALVDISRKLDGSILSFLVPLIIDSTFHKFSPRIFAPNIISLMQNDNITFTGIQKRKRIDRILQSFVIITSALLLKKFVSLLVSGIKQVFFQVVSKFKII